MLTDESRFDLVNFTIFYELDNFIKFLTLVVELRFEVREEHVTHLKDMNHGGSIFINLVDLPEEFRLN